MPHPGLPEPRREPCPPRMHRFARQVGVIQAAAAAGQAALTQLEDAMALSKAVAPSEAAAVAPGGASVLQREVAVALREAALTLRAALFAQREAAVSLIEAEMDL